MLVILWDSDGNRVEADFPDEKPEDLLEGPTSSFDELSASFNVKDFLAEVESVVGKRVVSMHKLGYNHFWVFDLTIADSSHIVARLLRRPGKTLSVTERESVQRECAVLQWLARASDVPAPVVHYFNIQAPIPYMLTSKCSGVLLSDSFGALSEHCKLENVRSFSRIALNIFTLPVPQKIGSISQVPLNGEVILGDIIPGLPGSPRRQFDTAEEYFKWLLSCRKESSYIGTTPSDVAAAEKVLAQLEIFIQTRLGQFEPSLFRTALVHDDFMCHNVFNDGNGIITGIIDWETHSVKPAFLAASYPTWLRYDGNFDPGPVTKDGQFSSFWMASPSDAQKLRDAYDSIIQVQNPYYYKALKVGEHLRVAEEMLLNEDRDFGCSDLENWLKTVPSLL